MLTLPKFYLSFFSAVREDRYFVTGRAIAVSLVHGGPSPNFLSQTLFDCIVQGPAKSRPNLGDIADSEIREKIQKVCCIFISSYSAFSICLIICAPNSVKWISLYPFYTVVLCICHKISFWM